MLTKQDGSQTKNFQFALKEDDMKKEKFCLMLMFIAFFAGMLSLTAAAAVQADVQSVTVKAW